MFLELTADTQRDNHREDSSMTATAIPTVREQHTFRFAPVPLGRIVRVELRKMFNTRSGFWLLASIVIVALLTMVGTVLFAPNADLTYYTFAKAIGFPMTVVLPIIAILSITGEVEPAHRADHVHAGPAPAPGPPGQDRSPRWSSGPRRWCSRSRWV